MITISKILSSSFVDKIRKLKVLQLGNKTAYECAPFGDDSNPLNNMTAIYAETSNINDKVIIGYINKNQIADKGEKRLYSLDSDGNLSSYLWLKNNGTIEVNGSSNSSVRFSPLKNAISTKDDLINAELIKIQTALSTLGGTYVRLDVSTNMNDAESDTVKID